MNLLLFNKQEIDNDQILLVKDDPRFQHLTTTLKLKQDDTLKVGAVNGRIGTGQIMELDANKLVIRFEFNEDPPPSSPVQLILALPRPKVVGRVIKMAAELGVKKIWLIQAAKVEKYYWDAHQLEDAYLKQKMLEGLSQVRDTVMPELIFKRQFRPFAEDELADILSGSDGWVAHPYADKPLPVTFTQSTTIIVGPEGGWVDFELELLQKVGCRVGRLGKRIMSTPVFLPVILGRGM